MTTLKSVDVWIDDMSNSFSGRNSGTWNVTNAPIDTIQGKMVTAQMSIDAHQAIQMDDLELKNRLITKLVRELMNGKYIEFTKQEDVVTMETTIRARIFVTPDEQVRVIRKANNV